MNGDMDRRATVAKTTLLWVFLLALLVRWIYDLALFSGMGEAGLMGVDSDTYLGHAQTFAAALANGTVTGWQWFGSTPFIMPLFRWLLTLHVLCFGASASLSFVLMQGMMDAAVCVLVAMLAAGLNPRWAIPAGVAAAINPSQIVVAGLLYTDTMFLLFTALFLLASVRWLARPTFAAGIALGVGLGGALFTRVLIAPYAIALIAFLLLASALMRKLRRVELAQMCVAGGIFAVCLGSLLVNNAVRFGSWSLSAQTGVHMAFWVVPLVEEAHDGTPWKQSYDTLWQKARKEFGPEPDDLFERSRQYRKLAGEELAKFTFADFAKAWLTGVIVNIGSPGIILSPPISTLPRTGFYGTQATSFADKVKSFVFAATNPIYAWFLIAGLVGIAAVRLIELVGVVQLIKLRIPLAVVGVLLSWCIYILLVNGPVASPKYRLPMEPVFVVLTAAGWTKMMEWRARRAQT